MFSVAFSILFLAQVPPNTLPTTENAVSAVVRSADSVPAETQAATVVPPIASATTRPATEPGTMMGPTIAPATTQSSVATSPDAGKTTTVTGALIKLDPAAKTVTVRTSSGTDDTYSIAPGTTFTLDDKPSSFDGLVSAGSVTLTITADSTKTALSIAAVSPPWWAKIKDISPIALMVPVLGLFMLLSIRNKKKQEKAQQEKLGSIKRGDRIQTIGGIIGNVVQTEETRVLVKVDESNNTKIWFARSAVGRVLGEDKSADAKSR